MKSGVNEISLTKQVFRSYNHIIVNVGYVSGICDISWCEYIAFDTRDEIFPIKI